MSIERGNIGSSGKTSDGGVAMTEQTMNFSRIAFLDTLAKHTKTPRILGRAALWLSAARSNLVTGIDRKLEDSTQRLEAYRDSARARSARIDAKLAEIDASLAESRTSGTE